MSGGSSQCLLGELTRLGEDGVLAELCDVLKRAGCNWLENEVPTGNINREQLWYNSHGQVQAEEEEKAANRPDCSITDTLSSMHGVQERGDRGGPGAGSSSLHQLWYDPSYPIDGDYFHEHDIRTTKEWAMHKDPLLLSCSLFPIRLDGYASIDKTSDLRKGTERFASCLRWRKLSRRKRSLARNP